MFSPENALKECYTFLGPIEYEVPIFHEDVYPQPYQAEKVYTSSIR